MYLDFPYEYGIVEGLGRLFFPVVRCDLWTVYGWVTYDFLVDTGADVTTVSSGLLGDLGLNKQKLKTGFSNGVGGIKVQVWDFKQKIKIGNFELEIQTSAVDSNKSSPFLLGRKDVFDKSFNLILDSKNGLTRLEYLGKGKP